MENACLQWTRTKDYSKMCYINTEDKGVFQKRSTASLLPLLGICADHPHLAALFPLGKQSVTHTSNQTLRRWRDTVASKQREKASTLYHQEASWNHRGFFTYFHFQKHMTSYCLLNLESLSSITV